MSEGNTVFLSLSPAWDAKRAPKNRRALTIFPGQSTAAVAFGGWRVAQAMLTQSSVRTPVHAADQFLTADR